LSIREPLAGSVRVIDRLWLRLTLLSRSRIRIILSLFYLRNRVHLFDSITAQLSQKNKLTQLASSSPRYNSTRSRLLDGTYFGTFPYLDILFSLQKGDSVPTGFEMTLKRSGQKGFRCIRDGCDYGNNFTADIIRHIMECPTMPEEYYQCLHCTFYTELKDEADGHRECDSTAPEFNWSTASENDDDDEFQEIDNYDLEKIKLRKQKKRKMLNKALINNAANGTMKGKLAFCLIFF